jgi:hypothetical protein
MSVGWGEYGLRVFMGVGKIESTVRKEREDGVEG